MPALDRLEAALAKARAQLLAEREPQGHWVGQLATSALSTATAISALSLAARAEHPQAQTAAPSAPVGEPLIAGGLRWLAEHQNADGGWGDTDRSYSNIATTMLVVAAFHLAGVADEYAAMLARAERYVDAQGRIAGLRKRYGIDKTFAVPILTNCALAGLVPWQEVSALPFELACLPQAWYRFARLPVVSYAIPALVAIGQARFHHRPPWIPYRWIRGAAVEPSLEVLLRMQPASGGYLEAVPLTSFVVMSLASIGRHRHPVAERGLSFLRSAVRSDGSWPIDTNLATWNTTLAINALAAAGDNVASLPCWPWLLSCQHRSRHPFTGAAPGGWGWSDLSGAVPDADDTPGALLALAALRDSAEATHPLLAEAREAAALGLAWLGELQNRDGGWPTFCRGWGKLPFDRSGADLTAHALRAIRAWRSELDAGFAEKQGLPATSIQRRVDRGFLYLDHQQQPDGAWLPLWFGNQDHPAEANPVYGTAKVLLAYRDYGRLKHPAAQKAANWLLDAQSGDGGWGAGFKEKPSSVEETALAVEALAGACPVHRQKELQPAMRAGAEWLATRVESESGLEAAPIGFYFAKLWYYERLYPLTFTVSALGRAVHCLTQSSLPRSGREGRARRVEDAHPHTTNQVSLPRGDPPPAESTLTSGRET